MNDYEISRLIASEFLKKKYKFKHIALCIHSPGFTAESVAFAHSERSGRHIPTRRTALVPTPRPLPIEVIHRLTTPKNFGSGRILAGIFSHLFWKQGIVFYDLQ